MANPNWLFFIGSSTTLVATRPAVTPTTVFRKTLAALGTRVGTRQPVKSAT